MPKQTSDKDPEEKPSLKKEKEVKEEEVVEEKDKMDRENSELADEGKSEESLKNSVEENEAKEEVKIEEGREMVEESKIELLEEETGPKEKKILEKVEKAEFLEYRKEEKKTGGFFDDLYKSEKKDKENSFLHKLFFQTHFHSIYFFAILLIIALVLLGSWYALENRLINFGQSQNPQLADNPQQLNVEVIEENIATPSAEEVEDLKIQVLNGSGVRGQASEVKNKLISGGFEDIATGNDADWDGEKTEIKYAKGTSDNSLRKIKEILEKDFSNITLEEGQVSSNYSVVITTGK